MSVSPVGSSSPAYYSPSTSLSDSGDANDDLLSAVQQVFSQQQSASASSEDSDADGFDSINNDDDDDDDDDDPTT